MLGATALHHAAHADAVLGEHAGHGGQHAGTVGNGEADVVLGAQLLHGNDGQVVGAGAADHRRDAERHVARNLQHVAHDRRGGRTRAGALTEEHGLAHGVARYVDCVEHAVDLGHLMGLRQHGGMHAHIDALGRAMRQRQQLDDVAHVVSGVHVKLRDVADALGVDIVELHAAVKGDRCQDGDLRSGVETVHVGGGVGLGEALRLSLGQRVLVGQAVVDHAREHVVGGAVHDAHDGGDLVADEGMLQRLDDGDAAADAGLEAHFQILLSGKVHDLVAEGGHERLVGSDHVLAGTQGAEHHVARGGGAADQLDDDIDLGVVDDVVEVLSEQVQHAARLSLLGIARAHSHHFHVDAQMTLEVLAMVAQDVQAAAADGARSHESKFNGHVSPFERLKNCARSAGRVWDGLLRNRGYRRNAGAARRCRPQAPWSRRDDRQARKTRESAEYAAGGRACGCRVGPSAVRARPPGSD